jgi:hypothetical protein
MEAQKTPNSQATLSKKSSTEGITIPDSNYTTEP